ncbi:MAG: hypothetical protein RML12_02970 [Xanthomonadales bacterium]|nr:hypothetical protein [Xanthomonadales bacterium]
MAIADREYEFTVTSLREAEWSSFRVNFFILLHPAAVARGAPPVGGELPPARPTGAPPCERSSSASPTSA